jgi:high affinity Mn2+ porin
VTIGKISPPDIFDANKYAHDSRQDFLNWALVDTGSYDYAADAWGYTVGAVAEWYEGSWTARLGVFDLSATPNSTQLDAGVGQFQWQGELEKRFQIHGEGGAIRLTGFLSRGRMGRFADALALAAANGTTPDIAAVREYRSRGGIGVSLDQQIRDDLGLFVRAGLAGGDVEPFDYTDIDRTAALGLSLNGKKWGRGGDTVAIAGVVNGISSVHEAFLAAGGLGILVGDGRLPHPGPEQILESYYDAEIRKFLHIALDYQFIDNPAYNRDRGPVSVFGARLHIQF